MDPAIDLALRLVLAARLAAAAAHKLREPAAFRATLADYRLLPPWMVPGFALLVPLIEIGAAGALLTPAVRSFGGLAAAGLLVAYSLAIAVNLARGRRHIDCGCGGFGDRRSLGWDLVARNLALLAAALATLAPPSGREPVWIDVFTAVAATLTLAAVSAAAARLVALRPLSTRLRGAS